MARAVRVKAFTVGTSSPHPAMTEEEYNYAMRIYSSVDRRGREGEVWNECKRMAFEEYRSPTPSDTPTPSPEITEEPGTFAWLSQIMGYTD